MHIIYLASLSPRRQEILQQMGVKFIVLDSQVDETFDYHKDIEFHIEELAIKKVLAGLNHPNRIENFPVLAADTMVVLQNHILGKPKNIEEAKHMLSQLSDKTHQVITAVAINYHDITKTLVSNTKVTFAKISDKEIDSYCQTAEPLDKAGAYAIQGRAAIFIKEIQGSYSGVMGLPIYETAQLLQEVGMELF